MSFQWAQAEGDLIGLILAARNSKPKNPRLRAVAEISGVAPKSAALESVWAPGPVLVGVEEWRERMSLAELPVCRVEIAGDPSGTGFLVGPDYLLTSNHVLNAVFTRQKAPETVGFRFDYKASSDGMTLKNGIVARLAADWLVDTSPPLELDYALLRIEERVGENPIGNQTGASARGWLIVANHDLTVGERLFIIQHPMATPMKLGTGRIENVSNDETKFCHDTDTEPGSSGSPCFSMSWELVGLHQHGKGYSAFCKKNGAISLASIVSQPKVREALLGRE